MRVCGHRRRKRFQRGDHFVTVGKRTVCFYRMVDGKKPEDFQAFDIGDYQGIRQWVDNG